MSDLFETRIKELTEQKNALASQIAEMHQSIEVIDAMILGLQLGLAKPSASSSELARKPKDLKKPKHIGLTTLKSVEQIFVSAYPNALGDREIVDQIYDYRSASERKSCRATVSGCIAKLKDAGKVERTGIGRYRAVVSEETTSPIRDQVAAEVRAIVGNCA